MFTIDISSAQRSGRRFITALRTEINSAMRAGGEQAIDHVRKHSRFHRRSGSGSLKDATRVKFRRLKSGAVIRVQSTKHTAPYLEYGTRPHKIIARAGKMLRFQMRGKTVYARRVMHPGTRPTKFLWNATNAGYRYAGTMLKAGMLRAAKRFR